MKIKVCGMKFPDNIANISALSPDYLGFIFYKPSPRYVGDEPASTLFLAIPAKIKKVAVFVNESIETILAIVRKYNFEAVQLHGDESPEFCKLLMDCGLEVFKAFRVDENFDFSQLLSYQTSCHFVLFDTRTSSYGGSGEKFDWQLLKNYTGNCPIILSGGISESDALVIKTLNINNLYAVDLNSKFEVSPGFKDVETLSSFFELLKH